MPQIINTNIASLNAQRNLDRSQAAQETALQRLSSGLRINSAKDDAAGLTIANRLDAQVRGLSVASRNAGDGVSLAQIAEGSIETISTSLQRLRELAVQSSNATNGDSERSALNAEAQQIISEIERTAESATFNGVNLLDGSFQGKSFQIGANVGDEVSVSLGSVSTDSLGSSSTSGLTSNNSKAAIAGNATGAALRELVSGDLVINGVTVGGSSGGADNASSVLKGSSAIAKAAAINAVSEQTGVTATAAANTVEGNNLTTVTGAATNISINGVAVAFTTADAADVSSTGAELAKVADEVNQVKDQTGVTASVVSTATGFRIDLAAEDGRNISVLDTTGTAAAVGLPTGGAGAALTVYTGNVTLSSADGSDIALSSTTGNIDNAGFEAGTFSGSNAQTVGDTRSNATGGGPLTALAAGDVTINGVAVGPALESDDVASTTDKAGSAIAIAAAINKISDQTGVTAEAAANTFYSGNVTASTALAVNINGVAVAATGSASLSDQVDNYVTAFNEVSGQTGVRAEVLDGDSFTLIADDGRNISITGQSAAEGLGATDLIYAGAVSLSSGGQFDLGTNTGNIERSGLNVGSFGASETGTLLKDVDISTVAGAEAAISAVDNALNAVNSERAKLGAVQSRFESVISSNAISIENFSASASRIQDADFAAETAALSKSQVLQQAGISVLAQANARPQQVLSLLQ